ncbi:hypothetical protein DVH24_041205 [Malus domestica]|uniref:Uncharacterized protein n=1 Tax=Malus domestica TaxID=3750 RepID=A0A498I8G8_MALDO|nr:hypothetical protein DVH24_041205 [Malus domestica]
MGFGIAFHFFGIPIPNRKKNIYIYNFLIIRELFQPLIVLDLICAVDLSHFSSSVHLFQSATLTLSLRPSPTSSLTRLSNSDQPPAHHHTILSSLTLQPSFTTQPPLSLAISLSHGHITALIRGFSLTDRTGDLSHACLRLSVPVLFTTKCQSISSAWNAYLIPPKAELGFELWHISHYLWQHQSLFQSEWTVMFCVLVSRRNGLFGLADYCDIASIVRVHETFKHMQFINCPSPRKLSVRPQQTTTDLHDEYSMKHVKHCPYWFENTIYVKHVVFLESFILEQLLKV